MSSANRYAEAFRRPSAFIPVALSLTALAIVLLQLAIHGAAREPDEGAAAHLWQLAMAAQVPIIAYALIRWLPKAPRVVLAILAAQLLAALCALLPVYLLKW